MTVKNASRTALQASRHELPADRHAAQTEIWFFLALGIWIVRTFLATTLFLAQIEPVRPKPLLAVALALVAIGEARRTQDLRAALGIGAVALAGISFLSSGAFDLLAGTVFIYAARNIEFARIARFCLALVSVLLSFVVLSSLLGIVEDHVWGLGNPHERLRHGLGFRYVTFPTHYFLEIVLLYGYVRRERSSGFVIAILLALDCWIFAMTGSRNSFLLSAFFLIFLLVMRLEAARRLYTPRLQRITAAWIYPVGAVGSYVLARSFTYASPSLNRLNSILSNRLAQTHASLERYGVTFFGQHIRFMGNGLDAEGNQVKAQGGGNYDYNFIDNSFMGILVNNGVVILIVAVAAFTVLGIASARRNDRYLSAILFVTAIHSMIDPQLLDLTYNTFLLLLLSYGSSTARTVANEPFPRQPGQNPWAGTPCFPTATYPKEALS